MFHKNKYHVCLLTSLATLIILLVIGCAANKAFWGNPKSGLILQYRLSEGQVLKYQTSSDFIQTLEIMGNTMEVESTQLLTFSLKCTGQEEDHYDIGVTIDTMFFNIFSPQGDFAADMGEVMGKSFNMTVSILGKEKNLIGVDEIQYDLASEGKRSIRSEFENFFPDMVEKPLKIGDSWESAWHSTEKSESGETRFEFKSINVLEGYEIVNGMDCARLTAKLTGSLEGTGEQQGMDLVTEAEIEGTIVWYFAYQKGILVQSKTSGIGEGTISASGAQNMNIPMVREFEIEAKLVQ